MRSTAAAAAATRRTTSVSMRVGGVASWIRAIAAMHTATPTPSSQSCNFVAALPSRREDCELDPGAQRRDAEGQREVGVREDEACGVAALHHRGVDEIEVGPPERGRQHESSGRGERGRELPGRVGDTEDDGEDRLSEHDDREQAEPLRQVPRVDRRPGEQAPRVEGWRSSIPNATPTARSATVTAVRARRARARPTSRERTFAIARGMLPYGPATRNTRNCAAGVQSGIQLSP